MPQSICCKSHEEFHYFTDKSSGLRSFVAIHSSFDDVAMGATRLFPYTNDHAAISDALRLSKLMTQKAAAAGLRVGGAKAVIVCRPEDKNERLLSAYGEAVNSLRGKFITGEDVNLTTDDVKTLRRVCPHIVGFREQCPGPIRMTALGVFLSIKAALRFEKGDDSLNGVKIGVQGVGKVGAEICRLLAEERADITVADINRETAHAVATRYHASSLAHNRILQAPLDVLVPCALGGILNPQSIGALQAKVVVGAANNQLQNEECAYLLKHAGITYCPDFIVNAGGLIEVYHQHFEYDEKRVLKEVYSIPDRLIQVLTVARDSDETTQAAAIRLFCTK